MSMLKYFIFDVFALGIRSSNPLLLAADDDSRVRFLPNADFFGLAGGISLRSWDRSDGSLEGSFPLPDSLPTRPLSVTTLAASLGVNPVNDPHSIHVTQSQFTVGEDSGPSQASAWFADLSAGPNEVEPLSFVVEDNSNESLFESLPQIGADGRLRFTPAANAHGSAQIIFHVSDGLLTSAPQTITIIVNARYDAPTSISLRNNSIA